MLYLVTYEGKRPAKEEFIDFLKLNNFSYLTATKMLEKECKDLIPNDQEFSGRNGEKFKKALFDDVIEGWSKKNHFNIANTGTEKTTIQRAVERVSRDYSEMAGVFKKDTFSWFRVIRDLAAQGIDLKNGFPSDLQEFLVNPSMEAYISRFQSEFYEELSRQGLELYENAARKFMDTKFIPKSAIIMEGFTYLTPLQTYFVDICERKGSNVYFVVPYSQRQAFGFDVIKKTYSIYPNIQEINLETSKLSHFEDISYLQEQLFTADRSAPVPDITNIKILSYPNRDREVLGGIRQLRQWFEEDGYTPEDVAVVTRRSKEFIDLLHDYLQINPIFYTSPDEHGIEQKIPIRLNTPPRLLLLTPVGRFVLTLYNIWENQDLLLDANQMEMILGSGWLGLRIQNSTPVFRAIKFQYFAECRTKTDWLKALGQLKEMNTMYDHFEHLPMHLVTLENIRDWEKIVNLLYSVCEKLFGLHEGSISEHITELQQQLDRVVSDDLRKSERLVLEKIEQVFQELGQYYSIELTTKEFHEALLALTREEEQEESESRDESTQEQNHSTLIVTSPESIDGISKKCILYLAVDNQHVPALYREPWPFYRDQRNEHLQKERYMFLTVIRSVQERLVLSFAEKEGNRTFQPSTYIGILEKLLHLNHTKVDFIEELDLTGAPEIRKNKQRSVRRKEYSLEELAHYGLCPLRYRLESLHPEAKMFRNDWQLEAAAAGVWLEFIYGYLRDYNENWPELGAEKLYNFFQTALGSVESQVVKIFPAFTEIKWHAVRLQVQKNLQYWAKYGTYRVGIKKGIKDAITLIIDEERDPIKIHLGYPYTFNSGKLSYAMMDPLLSSSWLHAADKTKAELPFIEDDYDVKLFADLSHAVAWWSKALIGHHLIHTGYEGGRAQLDEQVRHYEAIPEDMLNWIKAIEDNYFPKHAGEHCKKCPVILECLGIQEEEIIS